MTRVSLLLTISALCTMSVPGATILTENFDELTVGLTVTSAGVFSATGGTNVDIVGPGLFGGLCASPTSGKCLDLDGSGGLSQGTIQTSAISLIPGVNYVLSFDLIGSQRGNQTSTTVSFGSYSQTFVLDSGDTTAGIVTNAPITVSSPTSANLTFTSNTPGNVGALLDNVVITSVPVTSGVPEPSSSILLGSGLLLGSGILALQRRRKGRVGLDRREA